MNHIFYAEGIQDFQLRLCPFVSVKENFFKTTLLHPYRMGPALDYRKLTRSLTVRCASWNERDKRYTPVQIGGLVPVTTKDSDVAMMSGELVKFEYRGKGSIEDHPLRHVVDDAEPPRLPAGVASGDLEQARQTRIEGWAEQLQPEAPTGAFGDTAGEYILSSSSTPGLSINGTEGMLMNQDTIAQMENPTNS